MIERLGTSIAGELARFGAVPGLAPIVDAWPAAVGPEIARNAWPARLARDGTLLVHTSSSAWAFELAQLEARIRTQLAAAAPRKLRFAVGPLPESPVPPKEHRRRPPEPSPADERAAAEIASRIADENLRKIVAKAAALSLSRAASDRSL